MKIKAENILINDNKKLYKKIIISGTDSSLIDFMVDFFVQAFKEKNYIINTSGEIDFSYSGDLFSESGVFFVLRDYSFKNELPSISKNGNWSLIASSTNSKKTNNLKGAISLSQDDLFVECYPLSRPGKVNLLKKYVEKNNISITGDVFWYVIEHFENEYVFFLKQIETLFMFKKEISSLADVENAVYVQNKVELSKIFFHILENNKSLTHVFKQNIYSQSDLYVFISSLKLYLEIIKKSKNESAALALLPKYLFNEKSVFKKIHKQISAKKILTIYKNIFKLEKLVRKNPNLFFSVGLRFLLSTKKTIVS